MIDWSVPSYAKAFLILLFVMFFVGLFLNIEPVMLASVICMAMISVGCFVLDGVKQMLEQLVRPLNKKE